MSKRVAYIDKDKINTVVGFVGCLIRFPICYDTSEKSKIKLIDIEVNNSPTGNCQVFCVASACNILDYCENPLGIFGQIANDNRVDKRIMLLDIQYKYLNECIKIFGDRIRNKFQYESTNHSNMVILLVDMTEFLNGNYDSDQDDDDDD